MEIDIWGVIANFTWILGLSVLFAIWSFASYEASLSKQKIREKFEEFGYAIALDVGLLIFIAGLAATEDRWWARILWIILGIGVIIEAVMRIKERKQAPISDTGSTDEHNDAKTLDA